MKTILLFLTFVLLTFNSYSQDKIYFKSGKIAPCIVKSIDSVNVNYFNENDIFKVSRNKIDSIVVSPVNVTILSLNDPLVRKGIGRPIISLKSSNLISFKDSINYELSYSRYCINKYRKECMVSDGLYLGSVFVAAGSVILISKNTPSSVDNATTLMGLSGLLGLIGYIVHWDSYKWLKRASIKPTQYGAAFEYLFQIQ